MAKLIFMVTDLTEGEYEYLMSAYRVITTDNAPQAAPVNEYEAARQHVEQPAHHALLSPQASTAPTAPGIQIPQPALNAAIEIDAEGVPWDGRYHSSTKTKTVKGVWSLRKGVNKDPATAAAAEAYRTQHRRGAPVAAPQAAPVAVQTPGVTMPAAPAPVQQSAYAPQQAAYTPPYVPDYGTWYQTLLAANQSGKLTDAVMTHINGAAGVPDMSHYQANDNARAISFPMLQQLAA